MALTAQALRADKIGRAAATLARAFDADPMVLWPLAPGADDADLTEHLRLLLLEYVPRGFAWEVADCGAVAAWLPPGAAALAPAEEGTRRAIAALTEDAGARYARSWDWVDAQLPSEPSWFLDFIGVDPPQQSRGLGRWLVDHGLVLARSVPCRAFLETGVERNVGSYERFGFTVKQHAAPPHGGPPTWFTAWDPADPTARMARTARTKGPPSG